MHTLIGQPKEQQMLSILSKRIICAIRPMPGLRLFFLVAIFFFSILHSPGMAETASAEFKTYL
ncbi:MAG: hypothetical protein JW793_09100, partial [Acidobacteria bacterium]|nr:hypothetical protein [Acidobacteriota bacterium]